MVVMSENRRNRRKNIKSKYQQKSNISRKDKIFGILAILIILILATLTAYYFSLSKAGLKLF
jgi:uncharacterized membrane protein YvbJ